MQNLLYFLLLFKNLKTDLEKNGLYDLVKESFWNWAIQLCIFQLKDLNKESKDYLFTTLHKKFNSWNYIDYSPLSSNKYRAIHYIKYQKVFPTINIAYIMNKKNFNFCLASFVSVLKNSEYENINLILLYNDMNQIDLQEINKLKEIRFFSLQTLFVPDKQFKDFLSLESGLKEEEFNINLLINFLNKLSLIEKLL